MPMEVWSRVKIAAECSNKTFSWVVRWCVFTALRDDKKSTFSESVTEFHHRRNFGASKPGSHHRFQLCLYGEDQTFLKISAIELDVSLTSLILASIEQYLQQLIEEKVSDLDLRDYGIKIFAKFQLKKDFFLNYPEVISFESFYFHNFLLIKAREGFSSLEQLREFTRRLGAESAQKNNLKDETN